MSEFSISLSFFYKYYLFIISGFCFLCYFYYKLLSTNSKTLFVLVFRMFSLLIIILLLLNPKVTYSKNIKNDNFINIYVDSSKSINEHIKKHKIEINSLFNILNTWSVNNEVNINYFSFSDSIAIIDNPTNIIYDSPSTDFSQLFNHIKSSPLIII